jgi:TPR repeat protein
VSAWIGVQVSVFAAGPETARYDQGFKAYQAGRHAEALEHWRPLAEAGDAVAQFSVGTLYDQGRGVPQDDAQATAWFRRAAEQGFAPAQFNLGNAYRHGRGVTVSQAEAVRWWRKAAAQGVGGAQFNLGSAYLKGDGVARDEEAARRWYERAVQAGHPLAAQMLIEIEASRAPPPGPPDTGTPPTPSEPRASVGPDSPQGHATVGPPPPSADRGAAWVRGQQSGSFTIQVLSGSTEQAVRAEIERHPLPEPVAIYPYRHGGAVRFALLHGTFPDRASASEALGALPPALRKSSPWVRSFGELQALSPETPGAR